MRGTEADDWGVQAWMGGRPVPLTEQEEAWRTEGIALAAELAAQGQFDVEIARAFPLDQAAEAAAFAESGRGRGKVVLLP